MKFHLNTSAGNVFTGYGDDYVRLGIVLYRENIVVTPERILTGWCPGGFDALTDADFAAVAGDPRRSPQPGPRLSTPSTSDAVSSMRDDQ